MKLTMRHLLSDIPQPGGNATETVHRNAMTTIIENECLLATDTIFVIMLSTMGSLLH